MVIRGIALIAIVLLAYLAFSKGKPAIDALTATEISTLLKKANEFDGKNVSVTGTVVHSAGIMGLGGYKLKQGEDEVVVITSHGVPQTGTQVTVSGKYEQAFSFNGFQTGVIVEK